MSWPDPGTPAESDPDHEPGPGDDAAAPTYARLRSEAEGDLGRWQSTRPPPDDDDPSDGDGDRSPAHVSTDGTEVAREDASGPGGAGSGDAPGGTREDAPGAAGLRDGSPDPLDTVSSPDTRSWEAEPERPEDTSGGTPGATGHADGPADGPAQGSGGPFHGERIDQVPTGHAPEPPLDAFHGERSDPIAPPPESVDLPPPPRSSSAAVIEDALAGLDVADRHATVICVANQKGGVGKTTTTVSLGAALAMLGAQVLVVDLDPQGNATTGLGLRAQEGAPSTYRVIVEQMDVEDAAEPTAVRGLHVLPSSLDLAGAEIELVPAFSRENRLRQALDAVRDLYDVILIDCPPSLGLLTINALVAADQVMVPIQCEYYALEGLGQLMRTVRLVGDSLNRGLGVGGVVLTMFDGRTNLSQQVVDEVRNYFGDVAYQTIVPRTVRLSEAPSYGQPIGVFDASSRGARAYQRLAREVARRLELELEDAEVSPLDRLLGSSAPAPEEAAPLPTDLAPDDVAAATEGRSEEPSGEPPGEDAEATAPQDEHPAEDHQGHGEHQGHEEQEQQHHGHEHPHGQDHGHDEPAPGTEGWT